MSNHLAMSVTNLLAQLSDKLFSPCTDRHIDVADDAKLLWAHGSTMAL